ncbi:MAG TPA: hypothetical protein PLA74_03605 [Syntrophales bacterium]|nr:hypothetical protein [Syntrophales bacterium]HPQ43928.1 hypothetical protein [Syntrophales bacterium]
MAKATGTTKPSQTTKKKPVSKKASTMLSKNTKKSDDGRSLTMNVSITEDAFKGAEALKKVVGEKDAKKARASAREKIMKLALESPPSKLSPNDRFLFAYSCALSNDTLSGYCTLDEKHIADVQHMLTRIKAYADDLTQTRPLNFLMFASPGAGKSHFIDCVAKNLSSRDVTAITFNMASMSSPDDLMRPLDEARNAKVEDELPLLFFDEFDSSVENYGLLLPLLWDGSLSLGERDLKLGKTVVVLAGSNPALEETLTHAKSMATDVPLPQGMTSKAVDLFSRINGAVISIPPFFEPAKGIDRRADKVAIGCQLLKKRFGSDLEMVPIALLRMIAATRFRYGVRSIAHLIDLIPSRKIKKKVLSLNQLGLPLGTPAALRKSSLAYHVIDDENHAHGIVDAWQSASKHSGLVPIHTAFRGREYEGRGDAGDFFLKMRLAFELERLSDDTPRPIRKSGTTKKTHSKKKA